jgi:hypothetical protein
MIPTGGPVTNVLWVILIILVLGFLGGSWLNRKRSKAIGIWLRNGLKPVGGQSTWKWIRGMNSAAQVTVEGAAKPFRRMEISYFLMTREFAPLWGYEWLRGKQDLLAARIELRDAPAYEVEIVPREGKLQQTLDANAGSQPFTWTEGASGLGIGSRGGAGAQPAADRLKPFVERYGPYIQRLSLRPRQPNVMLFLNLAGPETAPAEELMRALRQAVED